MVIRTCMDCRREILEEKDQYGWHYEEDMFCYCSNCAIIITLRWGEGFVN